MTINKTIQRGFTLIELLIVIAVLGVLAAVVLVALDPLEQLARGRDSGRISSIGQVGRAMQAFATANSGKYPDSNATWQTSLVNAGELKQEVNLPEFTGNCTPNKQNEICYQLIVDDEDALNTNAVIWTRLESKSSSTKAGGATPCPEGEVPIVAWVASKGQAGLACVTSANLNSGTAIADEPLK